MCYIAATLLVAAPRKHHLMSWTRSSGLRRRGSRRKALSPNHDYCRTAECLPDSLGRAQTVLAVLNAFPLAVVSKSRAARPRVARHSVEDLGEVLTPEDACLSLSGRCTGIHVS